MRDNFSQSGHNFDFKNAKAIDYGPFKGECLSNEALHSGPHEVSRCVSLPVQHQAIQTRAYLMEEWWIQSDNGPGARTGTPTDESPCKGEDSQGQSRMKGHGKIQHNPPPPSRLINGLGNLNRLPCFNLA